MAAASNKTARGTRRETVKVRVTDREKRALALAARLHGQTLSAFVRASAGAA